MVEVHVCALLIHLFDVLYSFLPLHLFYPAQTLYSSLPPWEDVQGFYVHPLNSRLASNLVNQVKQAVYLLSFRPVAFLHGRYLAVQVQHFSALALVKVHCLAYDCVGVVSEARRVAVVAEQIPECLGRLG